MNTATPAPTITDTATPIATAVQSIYVLTAGGNNVADTLIVMWATALWIILFVLLCWFASSGLRIDAE